MQRLVGRDHAAADLQTGQRTGVRAGRQHDVLALDELAADLDGVLADETAVALDQRDLPGLHEALEALIISGLRSVTY